jgi:hypothetical protein
MANAMRERYRFCGQTLLKMGSLCGMTKVQKKEPRADGSFFKTETKKN